MLLLRINVTRDHFIREPSLSSLTEISLARYGKISNNIGFISTLKMLLGEIRSSIHTRSGPGSSIRSHHFIS